MLKDASSSMLEDIVAQPSTDQSPEADFEEQMEALELGPELEPVEPEVSDEAPESEPTEPESPEQEDLDTELKDEPSTINDLVNEQETELDFATKVLWELAKDASQLVVDNKLIDDADEAEAEEVHQ